MIKLTLVLAVLLASLSHNAPRIDDMAWLAGCWERTGADRFYEEQWMAPRAGMMLGVSRTVRAGKVTAFEQMRMYERNDSLVFASLPSGQPPAEFVAGSTSQGAVTFSNPAHDFPQRVIYAPGTADSLFARIEGTMNGQQRGIDFHMKRTACAGSPAPVR
jgi:hypothetical protein